MTNIKNISRGCCFSKDNDNKTKAQSIEGGHKMEVFDWLENMPRFDPKAPKLVEVRFKNTRKSYFVNSENLPLKRGDIIAVEGNPGTDIGIVTITSDLVRKQIKRVAFRTENEQYKKVLRYANAYDIERWSEAISREHSTMIESRQISTELGLDMKIGDVEYQGDGMKAIFYYIADGRVDFRELIKVLFDRFRVRIEMKQIGARQEAGRIGGIGPCGRQLCCSSWMNSFTTIGIGAARTQDISLNPQKLAGQCGKLKCCLNYEVDSYVDAKKAMPRVNAPLEALDGKYFLVKSDPLAKTMYFSPSQHESSIFIPLSADRVREILAINAKGEKVAQLQDESTMLKESKQTDVGLQNIELEDSLTRFDRKPKSNNQKDRAPRNRNNRNRKDNSNQTARQNQNGAPQKEQQPQETTSQGETKQPRAPKPRNNNSEKANNPRPKPQQKQSGQNSDNQARKRLQENKKVEGQPETNQAAARPASAEGDSNGGGDVKRNRGNRNRKRNFKKPNAQAEGNKPNNE